MGITLNICLVFRSCFHYVSYFYVYGNVLIKDSYLIKWNWNFARNIPDILINLEIFNV